MAGALGGAGEDLRRAVCGVAKEKRIEQNPNLHLMNIRLILIPALLLIICSAGCITAPPAAEDPICSAGCITAPPAAEDPLQPLDYSLSENWAYLPNASDEKPVDVFYLYPTLFKTLYVDSMNTSDPELRDGAVTDVLMKKGVFDL